MNREIKLSYIKSSRFDLLTSPFSLIKKFYLKSKKSLKVLEHLFFTKKYDMFFYLIQDKIKEVVKTTYLTHPWSSHSRSYLK